MARPKNSVPTYRLHKPSNTARCWLNGGWVTLGKYNSPESRAEYARILAELAVAPLPSAVGPAWVRAKDITVNELLLGFWRYAETHYRRADGTPTNELPQFRQTFQLLRDLYGHTPAAEFSPLALKAVREKMIEKNWNRKLVNQRIGRIRREFLWGVENEVVSPVVLQALAAVKGLQAGRTAARETDPVVPVADDRVEATLPFLRPAVRAMVRVQRLTGMRPGEVCQLRPCDLDTARPVWRFTPPQYKTKHRGKPLVITLGPKAQAELAAFAPADPTDYYFSPRRVVADLHAERGANRKTPRFVSHMTRNAGKRKAAPARVASAKYTVTSYGRAVSRACEKAFPPPAPLARRDDETEAAWWERLTEEQKQQVEEWRKEHHWHPNQLRHAHATEVRERFGLEAAQVALRHSRADVTQVYAERDLTLAEMVSLEMG
jgi:integrase